MTEPRTNRDRVFALVLCDLAVTAWLWYAFWWFTALAPATPARVLCPAIGSALIGLGLGHGLARLRALITRAALLGLAVGFACMISRAFHWIPISSQQAIWLGSATAALTGIFRLCYRRMGVTGARGVGEVLRWITLLAAATLVMVPFYFSGSIGSGDAHWYGLMLGDFVTQLRAGTFPVWVGQSIYAFNGAVSPVRYAPGFQYAGGILDILTAQALFHVALKNLCLCMSAVLGAFSAYTCLVPIARASRWLACALAVLWVASPGVLAPVTSGDQYMTFMTLPFVPLVLHGVWRVWAHDDLWSRFWIGAGLAGLWLCHSPIALWLTFISAGMYLPTLFGGDTFTRHSWRIALMAVVFLALGSLPFISILNLDNQIKVASSGAYAAEEVRHYFPANFKPISAEGAAGLPDYQIGYTLLGVLGLSLALVWRSRPRGVWAFAAAALLVIPCAVPVPFLTNAFWTHVPGWFVTINNVWPMQRLFLIWSALIVFTGALVLGSERVTGPLLGRSLVLVALACGAVWTGREAYKLEFKVGRYRTSPTQTRISEGPDNTQLTRYAYSSFASAPGYASHAYMEPWFENRLLDRSSKEILLANADAAAPGDLALPQGNTELVQSGEMTAENIPPSNTYYLRPTLTLAPGKRYALRLDFHEPNIGGVLQILDPSMFREYLMPDSGVGLDRAGPPKAFGSTPTSSHVVPMIIEGNGPAAPNALFITERPKHDNFAFARYWLYTYDRGRLPIRVESWIPYRVSFDSPQEAFLETPKMWLKDWNARVNGKPVRTERSPDGLVMLPVPAGPNHVTLSYHPPLALSLSFWAAALGWLCVAAGASVWLLSAPPLQEDHA